MNHHMKDLYTASLSCAANKYKLMYLLWAKFAKCQDANLALLFFTGGYNYEYKHRDKCKE